MRRWLLQYSPPHVIALRPGKVWWVGIICGFGWLLAVPGVWATEAKLAPFSPFLGDANGPTGSAVAPGQLELRGIMATAQGPMFAIYDPAKKYSSTWVGLNEAGRGYVVREYRIVEGQDQVKVDYQGRQVVLMLKKARIVADMQRQQSREPGQSPADMDPNPNQTLSGIPISDMLPGEKGRLDMFIRQVRGRLKREKAAVAANTPSAQSTAGK